MPGEFTIGVRDFGPIKRATLRSHPLTILIGPNNTGKSYLAMLTYAVANAAAHPNPSLEAAIGTELERCFGTRLAALSRQGAANGFRLRLERDAPPFLLRLEMQRDRLLLRECAGKAAANARAYYVPAARSVTTLPAETKVADADVSAVARFLERNACKGRIDVEAGQVTFRLAGGKFALPLSSSLVAELAPLIVLLKYAVHKGDLLIIEEPEAHLRSDMQRVVAAAIVRLVRAGVRVTITTHSAEMLQQIANFIRLARTPSLRKKLGYAAVEYLEAVEVGAYLLSVQKGSGTILQEIEAPVEEFRKISAALDEETKLIP